MTSGFAAGRSAWGSRAAEAMLRAMGGITVTLRLATGLMDSDARGLGLTPMGFEDVAVGPAVLHRRDDGMREMLVSAKTMEALAESRSGRSEDLCRAVLGLVEDEQVKRISEIKAEEFAGAEYLYRLMVEE